MKNIHYLMLIALLLPLGLFAQEEQTIQVGSERVMYTQTFNDLPDTTSYYHNDTLVLTASDSDKNGTPDVWVTYNPDFLVRNEMRDSDNDGNPDIYMDFDQNENLLRSGGEGLEKYTVSAPEQTPASQDTADTDYAGDLEDIEKLAGEGGGSWLWYVGILLLGVSLYALRKKKKQGAV